MQGRDPEEVTKSFPSAETVEQQLARARAVGDRLSIATQIAGIYCWELDWRTYTLTWDEDRLPVQSANPHFAKEYRSADFFSLVHPEDRTSGRDAVLAALANGKASASFRYRFVLPDGEIRHIQAYTRIYTDEAGNPTRCLGVSWDITREVEDALLLKQRSEQLAQAQRRLELASISSQEGHWEIDLARGKLWVSSSLRTLLGEPETAFETLPDLMRHVHPEDHARYLAAHEPTRLASGLDLEIRVRHGSGEWRWFGVKGRLVRELEGAETHLMGSMHDIHEQRLAKDAFASIQERFQRAIDGTQDGLWDWDIQTHSGWFSPQFEKMLGFCEGELPRSSNQALALLHPDDQIVLINAAQAHLDRSEPFDVECRMRTKTGEYVWVRTRGKAYRDENGRPVRMSGSLRDVRESRAARDALIEATQAAEEASRAKSAFIANMSHEIRTPMNGLIGMTDLLLETSLSKEQAEYARTVRDSAGALLAIINDILDFSKIEAGKLELEQIDLDMPQMLDDIARMLGAQAQAKGLLLKSSIDPDLPSVVRGDATRLRQVLLNLGANAVKFTHSGSVTIAAKLLNTDANSFLVRCEVQDTGLGIPSARLSSLFQPFMQVDASTTRKYGGTGLGLSIVKRLVELMGGEVGVRSEEGMGSTFWFTVTLARGSSPQSSTPVQKTNKPSAQESQPQFTGRVLLAEDNAVNQLVARRILERLGFTVHVAGDGRAAVAAWETGKYDLVLMDCHMPVMDGYEATRLIRSREPHGTRTTIIALTAHAMKGAEEECIAAGMDDYLSKPVDRVRLSACLERWCEGAPKKLSVRS